MAYRCKKCGYKFKKDDTDLCPECFTARDDTDCTRYEENHTHFKDSGSEESDDFIAKQLREEKSMTREEIHEKINDFKDTFKNFTDGNTSQNGFSQYTNSNNGNGSYTRRQSFSTETIKSNYNGGKSTLKFSTSYNPNSNVTYYSSDTFRRGTVHGKKAGCIVIVIFMIMSIFIGVISNVAFKMSSYYDDDYDYSSQTLSESFYFNPYYGFEQYNYDGNGSVVVTAAVYGNKFSSLSELLANNENLFDATVQNDTSDEIRNWQVIYVDIYSYGDFEIGGITLTALSKDDDGYNEIYSVSPKEYFSNTLMYAPVVPLIVSEDISDYTFEISTVDSDNSTETIEFDATYSQIKELADARASDESDESEDY